MTPQLKPVDNTPICDPDYLQGIDPLWMCGRVPTDFWEDQSHRRDYLLWVAGRLGLRVMADFYRLKLSKVCGQFHGSGVVIRHWGTSALTAFRDCFPEYDWKPWLFAPVPKRFWDLAANRRSYLDWLGAQLGFRQPEAWYRICTKDLADHRGKALLHRYASFYDLMREFLPELDWDRLDVHRMLDIEEILAWADAHHAGLRKWPTAYSGKIPETTETWLQIDKCLRTGLRGLSGGTSLPRLLEERRGVPVGKTPPPLSEEQILAWADAYFAAQGKWPTAHSGAIPGTRETWSAVQHALVKGARGVGPGSTLPRLLAERRGARNRLRAPPLTEEQILAWADAHFATHGKWPTQSSGPIPGTGETWAGVHMSLARGQRGLPGYSSLALLLAERRGARHQILLPALSERQILAWADAFFAERGKWPNEDSGAIAGTDETWPAVASAMRRGGRGLPRRLSLPQLLAEQRGARNHRGLPPLTEKQILAWADAYFAKQGKWPTATSGPVAGANETWSGIAFALSNGGRGLEQGSSLAQLLERRRGKPNHMRRPPLRESQILAWAHRFFLTEGRWPSENSGPIPQSPGDTWRTVEEALRQGHRGLPGGASLAKLLRREGLK